MRVTIYPVGWPVKLSECPPGPFCLAGRHDALGFKTEYGAIDGSDVDGKVVYRMTSGSDVYCLDSGEAFWAGAGSREERDALMVQPCTIEYTIGGEE